MRIIFSITAFFLSTFCFAQPKPFSLKEAIDYAVQNHVSMKNAALDVNIAKARVGEIRAAGLPQINGKVSLVDNTELGRMFFINGQNPFFTDPTKNIGEVVAVPNLFQLRSNGDASATISQLLFDGSYFLGLKASKAYMALARKSLEQTNIDVV